jgi:hypothetical protein
MLVALCSALVMWRTGHTFVWAEPAIEDIGGSSDLLGSAGYQPILAAEAAEDDPTHDARNHKGGTVSVNDDAQP